MNKLFTIALALFSAASFAQTATTAEGSYGGQVSHWRNHQGTYQQYQASNNTGTPAGQDAAWQQRLQARQAWIAQQQQARGQQQQTRVTVNVAANSQQNQQQYQQQYAQPQAIPTTYSTNQVQYQQRQQVQYVPQQVVQQQVAPQYYAQDDGCGCQQQQQPQVIIQRVPVPVYPVQQVPVQVVQREDSGNAAAIGLIAGVFIGSAMNHHRHH